ncbi:MAG: methyl-accepting chemotaxis protein [Deltaproteobacteria bacterium]
MKLTSVKARFIGSYVILIVLFLVQLPIVYSLVAGIGDRYTQVSIAGSLRKRAIELTYTLNRHILNGEEELEQVFQTKKEEYGKVIDVLRDGADGIPRIKGADAEMKLRAVEEKWAPMLASLNKAMESGDELSNTMREIESNTFPVVDKLNTIVKGFVALNDNSYAKSIDQAGLQRARTIKMAYLLERYARSNYEQKEVLDELNKVQKEFHTVLSGLKKGSSEYGLKFLTNAALIEKLNDVEGVWIERMELISSVVREKDIFQANLMELTSKHTEEIVFAADELTDAIGEAAKREGMRDLKIMIIAVGASIVLAVFFMWVTNSQIIAPIIRIKETVESFAHGDLTRRADVRVRFLGREFTDEVTELGRSVDEMAGQMSGVIGRIADSSRHLASASEELSSTSTQIATGVDKQSSQTTQVATSMEEMNATVIEVAKNSQQVSESARQAQDTATKGGDVVTDAIIAMKDVADATSLTADNIRTLGKSSEEIGTIVSVINDIADQTNLLALNAAIEAARAGEQGRGFAVVADEVRKLAERTTKATKEISSMIRTIQDGTQKAVAAMDDGAKKVENGVKLANEAGNALKRIVSGVEGVSDMISQIATSAEEQSATTDEISRNMESIAEVSRTNVAAIDEVAKASTEMASLAGELKDLVSEFRILNESASTETSRKTQQKPDKGLRQAEPAPLLKASML